MVSLSFSTLATVVTTLSVSASAYLSKPHVQSSTDRSSILRYLGGTGPFVEFTGYGISSETPYQCTIDQAHLFMRHGERYPTTGTGKGFKTLLTRLKGAAKNSTQPITGPLAFVEDYDYFVPDSSLYEQESFSGPYGGSKTVFELGSGLRERYSHLVNINETLPIFASGQYRVVQTAKNFANGFFNYGGENGNFTILVIPEEESMGANSLTNTDACTNFNTSAMNSKLANQNQDYLQAEADRLNYLSPGLNITAEDIYTMAGYCGFELNVRGTSKFCDALSMDAFVGFGNDKDLTYYYSNGPGYNMSYVSGGLYANATATLLSQGPENAGSLYFSFSHDNDLLRYVTALGLFEADEDLDASVVDFNKNFRVSEIVPMSGRLSTERLSCYNETSNTDDIYVRMLLNDQVVPFPGCNDGPGYSCNLEDYVSIIESSMGDYMEACEITADVPSYISFYWDWQSGEYDESKWEVEI